MRRILWSCSLNDRVDIERKICKISERVEAYSSAFAYFAIFSSDFFNKLQMNVALCFSLYEILVKRNKLHTKMKQYYAQITYWEDLSGSFYTSLKVNLNMQLWK